MNGTCVLATATILAMAYFAAGRFALWRTTPNRSKLVDIGISLIEDDEVDEQNKFLIDRRLDQLWAPLAIPIALLAIPFYAGRGIFRKGRSRRCWPDDERISDFVHHWIVSASALSPMLGGTLYIEYRLLGTLLTVIRAFIPSTPSARTLLACGMQESNTRRTGMPARLVLL